MKTSLSVVMITKNAASTIGRSLTSVQGLADEIIVVDDCSTDKTVDIVHKVLQFHQVYTVFKHHEEDLGKQKRYAAGKAKGKWILILDSDEIVSEKLQREIVKLLNCCIAENDAYLIPYHNHFLGRRVRYGGEDYKMIHLFQKNAAKISPRLIHEKFELKSGKVGRLKGHIDHYSYRSFWQMYKKFTGYAIRDARQKKAAGEKSSLKKIFLYPPHMFWARFIKSKGYKDGWWRMPLDLGFAYMEFLTYITLALKNIFSN